MKQYMEAYCLLDVYLLAEVFTQFRFEALTNFGIDPCNFISLPGMALDCFLKKSKIQLDYIYSGRINSSFLIYHQNFSKRNKNKIFFSAEIFEMLQNNLRGGMSFASQRYCESAVYEDMMGINRTIDESGRFNIILDIDANNLYGCSQTFPLPYKDFRFLSENEKKSIKWEKVDLLKEIGYFVEVSLYYPEEIQNKTSSFPLCPENITINEEILSPYQKKVLSDVYSKKSYKSVKLTSTFRKREKIVLHGLNLQFYLKQGMKIEEIFRVISFKQKPFMKEWVDFCTEKRTKSKNDFEKNFWKLIVNSVYGKTIESISSRKKIKITTNLKDFSAAIKSPCYERHVIVNENISIVILSVTRVVVNRPYYIGFSILEISKLVMYEFFYSVLQPYFGQKGIQLLYSDTDSLAILVKTFNIIQDLENLKSNMDFSNLHSDHSLFSNENKALLFKFKEEFGLRPISRLCALKSKVYSFEVACNHSEGVNEKGVCKICKNISFSVSNINKLKGIQRKTAREIHFDKYLKCLSQNYAQRDNVFQISSKNQSISTNLVNKISLSSFDDKRYIYNCGIHSEPYSYNNTPFCKICGK